jgi:phosphoribosylamine--glycine ligase
VLSATAVGDSLDAARTAAYSLLGRVELAGGQYRRDIALLASQDEVSVRLVP